MAALFRDFSFDAPSPSQADHEAERASMNCSPTSMPSTPVRSYRPLTPPPCTMGDLAQLLGGQNLFISTSRSHHIPAGPPTPPSDGDGDGDDDDDDATAFPTDQPDPQPARPTYCRASASIMRMQRLENTRLQCCSSQARDISRLVRMIQDGEQCTVGESSPSQPAPAPASAPAATSPADDEAIDMDYDCSLPTSEPLFSRPLYRATDRHNDSARVSKTVRMRKRSSLAKQPKERRKTR